LRALVDANLIGSKNACRAFKNENGMGDAHERVPGALIKLHGQLMAPAARAPGLTIQQTILGRTDEVLV
jgi:hypothetical protein